MTKNSSDRPASKIAKKAYGKSAEKSEYAGERVAKVLARVGVASRRDVEKMIEEGRVSVNGRKLKTPAFNVTDRDHISVDGKPIGEADPPRLWRYYKTAGLVTTERDPDGRPTVFQKLPADLPRLNSVGRLDINTEGLLLFTNDGGLKRYLELPSTGWLRRYRVRAFDGQKGKVDDTRLIQQLAALKDGLSVDGVKYKSIDAELERRVGGNVWITMALREGKNREIKKVLEHLNLQVNRLIRLSFGPFQLGQLGEGKIEEVPRRVLRQQLGKQWHELVDEDAPSSQRASGADAKPTSSTGYKPRANAGANAGTDAKPTLNKGYKPRKKSSAKPEPKFGTKSTPKSANKPANKPAGRSGSKGKNPDARRQR